MYQKSSTEFESYVDSMYKYHCKFYPENSRRRDNPYGWDESHFIYSNNRRRRPKTIGTWLLVCCGIVSSISDHAICNSPSTSRPFCVYRKGSDILVRRKKSKFSFENLFKPRCQPFTKKTATGTHFTDAILWNAWFQMLLIKFWHRCVPLSSEFRYVIRKL